MNKTKQNKFIIRLLKNRRSFFFFLGIGIFTINLAYSLYIFPGFIQPDHQARIAEMATGSPSQWHSLLWQIVAFPLLYLSPTIYIYGLFQIILFTLACVFAIYTFRKMEIIGDRGSVILAIIFAICPTYIIYNQLYSSDTVLAILLIPLSVLFAQISIRPDIFFNNKANQIFMSVLLFLTYEMRKNAAVVLIAAALVLFFCYKEYKKQLALILVPAILGIILFISINSIFIHAKPSPTQEMLSVPSNQIARVYAVGGKIPDNVANYLESVHPTDYWREKYDPISADPMKYGTKLEKGFLKAWLSVGIRNPIIYISAYFAQYSNFFNVSGTRILPNINDYYFALLTGDFTKGPCSDKCNESYISQINSTFTERQETVVSYMNKIQNNQIPILSDLFNLILFNAGLPILYIIATLVIAILRKKVVDWLIITLVLWSMMVSILTFAPVALFRYVMPMFYVLPVTTTAIVYVFTKSRK
jgi:hypothetical protein